LAVSFICLSQFINIVKNISGVSSQLLLSPDTGKDAGTLFQSYMVLSRLENEKLIHTESFFVLY